MRAPGFRHCSSPFSAAAAPPASGQLVPNLGGQRVEDPGLSVPEDRRGGPGVRDGGIVRRCRQRRVSPLLESRPGCVEEKANAVLASHTEYVAGIRHDAIGVMYHLSPADVVGCMVSSLHMADMEITTETAPYGTGRYFRFGDVAVGLTYARRMTDQLQFRGDCPVCRRDARHPQHAICHGRSRDLPSDRPRQFPFRGRRDKLRRRCRPGGDHPCVRWRREFVVPVLLLPTVFKLGFAFEPYEEAGHRLTASVQLNHPNDNAEHLRFGVEYAWDETFFLRAGMKRTIGQKFFGEDRSSEEGIAVGAGVRIPFFGNVAAADYAFADLRRLGSIHRISLESRGEDPRVKRIVHMAILCILLAAGCQERFDLATLPSPIVDAIDTSYVAIDPLPPLRARKT
ncbi:MAG: hypothetical protein MZV64_29815 [Ignavibacteriales bacterium]|nr:hypothetical protein [Ignavibacteriales bacterium]